MCSVAVDALFELTDRCLSVDLANTPISSLSAVLRSSIIFGFVYAIDCWAAFQLPRYQLTLIKRNCVTQTGIGWLSPWVVSFQ